ncbi:dihydroxyacetone kinase subunit L [Halobacillus kuroshimensis]|uniref:Dihydroxyacetone kinase subunit L n=1 Tax=Halobacillus kuroshimensis TaxID=302481 RepID=A0ABS3DV80_9BACI|nr:dihydroxyacetone kinase subunit DhaL [Halobacillus kuroshimensis]MBN8235227.1 dihydroxyacetone kinase subunit L [Halobacillus kuroshimensis]
MNVNQTAAWITHYNQHLQDQKDYLTSLDRKIGDGDHGINMARGFAEAAKAVEAETFETSADVLKKAAMTVMSKVGGASGPLYGTALLKMSMAAKGKDIKGDVFADMFEAAIDGIKQRGKAETGEKTMLDVWVPVLEEVKSSGFDAANVEETAQKAMEATKDLTATKGRASYLKERSKGHLDPGAVSSYYLFVSLAEALKEEG